MQILESIYYSKFWRGIQMDKFFWSIVCFGVGLSTGIWIYSPKIQKLNKIVKENEKYIGYLELEHKKTKGAYDVVSQNYHVLIEKLKARANEGEGK